MQIWLVLKCSSDNLPPPTNINLFAISFIVSKLLKYPLGSCSLINLDILLLGASHFDESFIFPLFVFTTIELSISVFFLRFKQ